MLGLWCAAGTPAGWLPLWCAALLRQHIELQTVRVRVKGSSVYASMYVQGREKERKGGEGGSGLRQAAREKANVSEKDREKGQTERNGGVESVSCQDDALGLVGASKNCHHILTLKMFQPCIIFFPL